MLRFICLTLVVGLSASSVSATLTAEFVNAIDNSPLVDFVTQDLMVTTTVGDDWGTAQLLTTLTAGSIYQDSNGSDFAPNPLLFTNFPELEFDTYLDGNGQQPSIAGQAVDLGGDVQEFSENHIDITWFNTSQTDFDTFGIGRFTLTDDAVGTWSIMLTSTSGFRTFQGLINNGEFDLRNTGGGAPVVGDLDSDGFVGITDLNIVLGDWNNTIFEGDPALVGDISGDFFVGIADLNTVLGNWNQFVFPGDTQVGDITGDGFVGIADLNTVLGNWNLLIPTVDVRADPSGDGFVGIEDLNTVLANWNAGTPPNADNLSVVPEPGSLTILALAGLSLMHARRR